MVTVGIHIAMLLWGLLVLIAYVSGHGYLTNWEWLRLSLIPHYGDFQPDLLLDRIGQAAFTAMVVSLFCGAGTGMGRRIARFLGAGKHDFLVPLCLGLGSSSVWWLGMGATGLWFPQSSWAMFVISVPVFGIRPLKAFVRHARTWRPAWWMLAVLPIGWITLAGAISPETELDPLRYHGDLAGSFKIQHKVFLLEGVPHASYPLGSVMLDGALWLRGELPLFKGVNLALFWLLGIATWQLAGRGVAGRFALLLWISIPVVAIHGAMAFPELYLAAMETAALLVIGRASQRREIHAPSLLVAGMLAGFALGSKYTAIQGVVPLLVLCLMSGRKLRTLLLFGGGAAVWALPWYTRNWLEAGNPVHPLFSSFFGSLEDLSGSVSRWSFSLDDFLGRSAGGAPGLPWLFLVVDDKVNAYPLGPAIACLLPLALLSGTGRQSMNRRYALMFGVMWMATTPGWGRYLIGCLPALLAASTSMPITARWFEPARNVLFAVLILVGQVLGAEALFQRQRAVSYLTGCWTREDFLAVGITPERHYLDMVRTVDRLVPARHRWYYWGMGCVPYSSRLSRCDMEYTTPWLYKTAKASHSAAEIGKRFRQRSITAFLYNMPGGITQAGLVARMNWTAREEAVWQEFVFTRFSTERVIEDPVTNVGLYLYRIHDHPAPRTRYVPGDVWPHLPGLEGVLIAGDRLHAKGRIRESRDEYRTQCRLHPDYLWAWQRLEQVSRELSDPATAARARSAFNRLWRNPGMLH